MSKKPFAINAGPDFGSFLDDPNDVDLEAGADGGGAYHLITEPKKPSGGDVHSSSSSSSIPDPEEREDADIPPHSRESKEHAGEHKGSVPTLLHDEADQDYDLEQGSRPKFRQSQEQMRQTLKGQTRGYGEASHASELKDFFRKEGREMKEHHRDILTPFITKYMAKLDALQADPNPSEFMNFLSEQQDECDAADDIAQPVLLAFLERERDYLLAVINRHQAEEEKEKKTCWYAIKTHAFHITGGTSFILLLGMVAWMSDALTYTSTAVSTSGDYPVVLARLSNKDAEQDNFMHNTLVAGGIGVAALVFCLGVFAAYQVVKHWVKAPLEKEVRGLRNDNRVLRVQLQDIRNVIRFIPVPRPHSGGGVESDAVAPRKRSFGVADPHLHAGSVTMTLISERAAARRERAGGVPAVVKTEKYDDTTSPVVKPGAKPHS